MGKKSLIWIVVLCIVISCFIVLPNFTIKARANMPEVKGMYYDDPLCKAPGYRCYECDLSLCWCRDAHSGDCC